MHSQCKKEDICLPIGPPPQPVPPPTGQSILCPEVGVEAGELESEEARGMERSHAPPPRLVPQVYYKFYRKPMAPSRVILASSALPWKQKRTALTQELIRRLLRTKKELSCKIKQEIISDFMQLLKNSGYCPSFRK